MVIKRSLLVVSISLLIMGCSSVAPGRLYTHITLPASTDFKKTPVGTKRCVLNEHSLKEPFSGVGVSVMWSSDRIKSAAQAAGITRIAYTEKQIFSLFLGIYTRTRLIVYGD
jgi:hypothetical protein